MKLEDSIELVIKEHPAGITAKEIAKILGVTKGVVNPILYRSENSKYRRLPQSYIWILAEPEKASPPKTKPVSCKSMSKTKTVQAKRMVPVIGQAVLDYLTANCPHAIYVLNVGHFYYVYKEHAHIVKRIGRLSVSKTEEGLEYICTSSRQTIIGSLSRYQINWLLIHQQDHQHVLVEHKFYGENNRYVPIRDAQESDLPRLKRRILRDQQIDYEYTEKLGLRYESLARYIDRVEGTVKRDLRNRHTDDEYY